MSFNQMKYNKIFYTLLMLLYMSLGFTSCSDDDNTSASDLVGTWEQMWSEGYEKGSDYNDTWNKAPDDPFRITFNEDGTFVSQSGHNGKWYTQESGTYSVNENKIYIRSNEDGEVYEGVATIVSKSYSQLVLEEYEKDEYGEYYEKITLERVN